MSKKKRNHELFAIPESVQRAIPSVEVIYFLENIIDAKDILRYYIVSDSKDEDSEKGIYSYKSDLAKELFCSFRKTRSDMAIKHNGKRYLIQKQLYANKKSIPEYIMPSHIVIREGTGYFSNELPIFCRNVDVLLYSSYTENYEMARVTYNEKANMCYMDLKLFTRYLKNYGYPAVAYHFAYTSKWETEPYWESTLDDAEESHFARKIRSKSVLKQFGYNVSQEDGLSREERHELLGEIMDLRLLSQDTVIQIIKSAIRLHSGDKYDDARRKWTDDIKFVENYHVDINRLLPKRAIE